MNHQVPIPTDPSTPNPKSKYDDEPNMLEFTSSPDSLPIPPDDLGSPASTQENHLQKITTFDRGKYNSVRPFQKDFRCLDHLRMDGFILPNDQHSICEDEEGGDEEGGDEEGDDEEGNDEEGDEENLEFEHYEPPDTKLHHLMGETTDYKYSNPLDTQLNHGMEDPSSDDVGNCSEDQDEEDNEYYHDHDHDHDHDHEHDHEHEYEHGSEDESEYGDEEYEDDGNEESEEGEEEDINNNRELQVKQAGNDINLIPKATLNTEPTKNSSELALKRRSLSGQYMLGQMDGVEKTNLRNSSSPDFTYEKIAREIYSSKTLQLVEEHDDLILATEVILVKLYEEDSGSDTDNNFNDDILSIVSEDLIGLWENYYQQTTVYRSEEYTTTVGPGPQAPNFVKANFIASLTLKVLNSRRISSFAPPEKPIPRILLEWMEEHHNPYPNQYEEILAQKPSPETHPHFWDTIFNCLIRGKIKTVINMIKRAGWRHISDDIAYPQDTLGQNRYSDLLLANVEKAMDDTVNLLYICPAIHDDWDSQNVDWKTFRLRALQAMEDLNKFIEGRDYDSDETFMNKTISGPFNTTAKKATSLIPWHLYQNLITLYNLIIGDMNTILANSQDWCEAVVGLVAWWDESKKDHNLSMSCFQQPPSLLASCPASEYFDRKLRISLEAATSESTDFQINSADEVQIALASLFEGDAESVIGFLCSWSGPVSCAVAEIASLAGWLPQPLEKDLISMGNLDQEDLDLLGIKNPSKNLDGVKDSALITYANNLCKRKEIRPSFQPEKVLNSWEISIAILGRLDSAERSTEIIMGLLNNFPLDNSETVNKLLILLNSIDLTNQAESVAQRYADDLAEKSHKYGEALYYYALAHKPTKVRNVLDILISNSLVLSSAYPHDKDLDDHLRSFITSPQLTLTQVAHLDVEAARLLQNSLSGYATLRKFYDLRDGDDDLLSSTGRAKIGTKIRKHQASSALIAVINSSSDQIRGGIYDRDRDAVIHVEFLLALLGEAIVFVDQPNFILTLSQIQTLLFAIEDVKAVPSKIYSACANFFERVLSSGRALVSESSVTTGLLQKSQTNISNSDFCLVSNSMLSSHLTQPAREKRGWDWRESFLGETTGDDLIRMLRFSLAKDLARAWLMEVDHEV